MSSMLEDVTRAICFAQNKSCRENTCTDQCRMYHTSVLSRHNPVLPLAQAAIKAMSEHGHADN